MAKKIKWKLLSDENDDVEVTPSVKRSAIDGCIILRLEGSGGDFCAPVRLTQNGTLSLPRMSEVSAERLGIQVDSDGRIKLAE